MKQGKGEKRIRSPQKGHNTEKHGPYKPHCFILRDRGFSIFEVYNDELPSVYPLTVQSFFLSFSLTSRCC